MFAGKTNKRKDRQRLRIQFQPFVSCMTSRHLDPYYGLFIHVTLNENMNRPGRNDGIFAAETILKRRVRDVSNNSDGCLLCWQGLMVIRCLVLFYFAGQSRVFHEVEWIFCQVSCVVL